MKILILIPSVKPGGLERVATLLANDFIKRDCQVCIMSLDNRKPFYEIDEGVNLVQQKQIPTNKYFRIMKNFIWLVKKLNMIKPDVILSFGERYNSTFILSALTSGSRNIYVSNRADPYDNLKGFIGVINPLTYSFAKKVILQTTKAKDVLKYKYYKSSFIVIPNPIPTYDSYISQNERENKIINVGTIGGKKNQIWLINYFKEFENCFSDWCLEFIGEGSKRESLEKYVKDANLLSKIIFRGRQKNVLDHLLTSSIFAFTSISEGFPNALGEAMAAGCACIAYDCVAGPSDMIDDEVNGFLIPVGDHELFQEKLKLLMQDQDLREKFGKNAREKMKLFEADIIADKFYNVLTEKLSKN